MQSDQPLPVSLLPTSSVTLSGGNVTRVNNTWVTIDIQQGDQESILVQLVASGMILNSDVRKTTASIQLTIESSTLRNFYDNPLQPNNVRQEYATLPDWILLSIPDDTWSPSSSNVNSSSKSLPLILGNMLFRAGSLLDCTLTVICPFLYVCGIHRLYFSSCLVLFSFFCLFRYPGRASSAFPGCCSRLDTSKVTHVIEGP